MAALNRKEEALVMGIVKEVAAEPGLPVRDLGALLHTRMATVLRVVQTLINSGVLERRQITRTRSDLQERRYPGLYLVDKKPAVAETMGTIEKPATAPEVVGLRAELRNLGERLGWSRLPLTQAREFGGGVRFGRAIAGGEEGWRRAVEELSDEDVEAALPAGRNLLALLGRT